MAESIVVAPRFCGPPTSGNGGYCSGLLAKFLPGTARVTLRRPIPLDRRMVVERASTGSVRLMDGENVVADAEPAELALEIPVPLTFAQAEAAAAAYPGLRSHAFPSCFVCGPQNAEGLRIYSGPVDAHNQVAAPWTPQDSCFDGNGSLRPEFVWAALDCPGYWAAMLGGQPRAALLGQFTVKQDQQVRRGERCIVVGWPIARNERKHRVGTALVTADGRRLAMGLGLWIEPRT